MEKSHLQAYLNKALAKRRADNLYRTRVAQSDNDVIAFASCDYLGLTNHPAIIAAYKKGIDTYGVGQAASQVVTGFTKAHQALEEELAEFFNYPRALVFRSGYMANLGIVTSLLTKNDTVLGDKLNHASLIDAARFSEAKLLRYRHSDMQDLATRLNSVQAGNKLIISDGVFSVDGDLAPVPELTALAKQHEAWVMVDDAHGVGVLGENGRGVIDTFNLSVTQVPIVVGTLSKGFGCFGAFVLGDEALIEYLIQFARTYIYTIALPAAMAEACRASLQVAQTESWRRDYLQQLITRFKKGAAQLGLTLLPSDTAIQPLVIGEAKKAMAVNELLNQAGFKVGVMRPPTVPAGSARLRIALSAAHSATQVDQLLAILGEIKHGREDLL